MCKHKQTIIKAVRYKKDYLQKVKLCVCIYIYKVCREKNR